MPSFNHVTLMGNLTRDPQTRTLERNGNSTPVTEFGLAVSRRFKSGGEDREEVLFIDCAAFGKQAETLGEYARKGRLLLVEGRLRYDSWEDRQHPGVKRSKISVVVDQFQFLGPYGEEHGSPRRDGRRAEAGIGRQKTLAGEYEKKPARADQPATRESAAFQPGATALQHDPDDIPF